MTFDTAEMTARHVAACRRLAEAAEALAMEAADEVGKVGTPEQKTAAIAAFHRASRSARQSMALEAMLVRKHLADLRWQAEETERREAMGAGRIRPHVRVGDRLVWHEAEMDTEWVFKLMDFPRFNENATDIPEDPRARLLWLEGRAEQAGYDLAKARKAMAEGLPIPMPRGRLYRNSS